MDYESATVFWGCSRIDDAGEEGKEERRLRGEMMSDVSFEKVVPEMYADTTGGGGVDDASGASGG